MYSVADYGEMIADRVRTEAYARALQAAVKPGAVVVDIGTGTGIFALLACKFGARRVYALEAGEALPLAREMAAANHCAQQIEFISGLSTQVSLPERADVIISDLRGVLPLYSHHLPSIADARRRFLAPGGTLIPRCDTMWAAVAEDPKEYSNLVAVWSDNHNGLDLRAGRGVVTNTVLKVRRKPEQLLVTPQCWATLDYTTLEDPNVSGQVTWSVARPGTAHGLSLWFDSTLADGVGFSNAPGAPEAIYSQMFFPWSEAVPLAAGDLVTVTLQADLVGEDYVWRWDTMVRGPDPAGPLKAEFRQSTFFGAPLSREHLRKRAADHRPVLDVEGQIDCFVLARMDGRASQEEIARQTAERFPVRFARWEIALTRVADLSKKYSQ